jgi:ABC-2 type transport system permease protein
MKIFVIAGRLIRQIAGDKRTLGVMLVAPILIMTLLYFLLGSGVTIAKIDIVGSDYEISDAMRDIAEVTLVSTEQEAIDRLKAGESDGYIGEGRYVTEGTDPSIAVLAKRAFLQYAQEKNLAALPPQMAAQAENLMKMPDIEAYYGSDDFEQFDFLAPSMMGFIIFFLVFLLAGIAFLRERISGTLDRILVSSLRRSHLVAGYFFGFGLFAALQTVDIQLFLVYVLRIHTGTDFPLVLLINLAIAGTSLAMGTLFSAFARNEFQLFQFIPIVIIPQMMFCGLINLRETPMALQYLARAFPLSYGAEALRNVMLRGAGFSDVLPDLLIMLGFTTAFFLLNILVLKRYRKL